MRSAAFVSLLLVACATSQSAPQPLPVDSGRIRLTDAVQWKHARHLMADLNGDGTEERVVLVSDVTIGTNAQPLWDGHRWAVFVEDRDQRTLLYGAFVPNGHVEVAIGEAGRTVLIAERTPHSLRTFVVAYDGPASARTVETESHAVERWLPSLVR
jgi:hypothetical protein